LEAKASTVYITDFGLSKVYRNSRTGTHISLKKEKPLIGTARYASINTHIGLEQSRRDDIESTIYVLIYFLKGKLMWQGLKEKNKDEKYNHIKELKAYTPLGIICEGLPSNYLHNS